MILEKLIEEINAAGWLITDLYQRAPRGWGASLRPANDWTCAYGVGDTALDALAAAWDERPKRMKDKDWEALKDKPKPGGVARRRLTGGRRGMPRD